MAAYFAALDPMTLVRALPGNVAQGIIWGIMALGVYITFRILDFADLTVDGSLATGGAVAVMLIRAGVNPALALIFAFLAGMAAGTVLTAILACFVNAFVLLPAYGKAFGMPIETFIQMGSAVHSSVNGLLTFALLIIAPFNIFKYALTSLIVFVIYKKIRVVLKGD